MYGYFLELHIVNRVVTLTILTKWTLRSRETAPLNLFLLYGTCSVVYRCGILHVSAVSRQKFGTAQWCLVKQIFCRMKVAIRWVVFYCSYLFGGRSSFTLFFAKHEKFSDIFPISKRIENNWAKATSSSGLFICLSNFLAITVDVILPYIANVIGELGIWANGNQTEYLKGYWVVLCSEVVAPVFKYVRRIFGLRLGHKCTLSSYSLWFPVLWFPG